jgi:hypothetical protein
MIKIDERLIPSHFDIDECIVLGWVWFSPDGTLKTSPNVKVELTPDKKHFTYNGEVYEPGLYYLVRRDKRVFLISDNFITVIDAKPLNSLLEAKMRSRRY